MLPFGQVAPASVVKPHFAPLEIGQAAREFHLADDRRPLGSPPQNGLDARQQFTNAEWLDDVIIRSAGQPSHAVILRAATLLDATMAGAIQVQRALTFTEVMDIQRQASALAARSEGAAFGAIRIPRVNLYAVYQGNAYDWRTTLRSSRRSRM